MASNGSSGQNSNLNPEQGEFPQARPSVSATQ